MIACMQNSKRIGLFGGSFDPIHVGHLIIAERTFYAANLDKVIFIPAGLPSFKQDSVVASAHDRLKMCELATLNNPHFEVSAIEVERCGVTYTYDTVCDLQKERDAQFVLIIGSDAFLEIMQWHNAAELISMVEFCVVMRPGDSLEEVDRLADRYNISATFLDNMHIDISSSAIREYLANKQSVKYLVPDLVLEYIGEKDLYTNRC